MLSSMSPIFLLITNPRPKKKKSYFLHKQRPSVTLILSNLHLSTIILLLRTNFHHKLPFYLKPYLPQQPHPLHKFRHHLLHPSQSRHISLPHLIQTLFLAYQDKPLVALNPMFNLRILFATT